MVRRALFRNSLGGIGICILLFVSCKNTTDKPVVPNVYVKASEGSFKQQAGFLYYNAGKFSGHTYELYPNGDTALLFSYFNGKEEGWCRKWYENKLLMEERFYTSGRKEGIHKSWWPDGKAKWVYHFQDDEHEGEANEWFNNGKPFRMFKYRKGHEEGLQRSWWEDGKVRANYVVKDGQQYGLIGRKLCINNNGNQIN